jgi:hypothetical protein
LVFSNKCLTERIAVDRSDVAKRTDGHDAVSGIGGLVRFEVNASTKGLTEIKPVCTTAAIDRAGEPPDFVSGIAGCTADIIALRAKVSLPAPPANSSSPSNERK